MPGVFISSIDLQIRYGHDGLRAYLAVIAVAQPLLDLRETGETDYAKIAKYQETSFKGFWCPNDVLGFLGIFHMEVFCKLW